MATTAVLAGCSGLTDVSGKGALPSGVIDPTTYRSPAGARGVYHWTVQRFERAYVEALRVGGKLTDEFQGSLASDEDRRELPEGVPHVALDALYGSLQQVRTYRVQAVGALAKYDTADTRALRGHAFAMAGYAEVLLADLYCSGVPLSELEFEGDFTYKPGSSTAQVYRHAVALFDTALTLAADSARFLNLARVGKGRALLALGDYDSAAAAVAQVPDAYQYSFPVLWLTTDVLGGIVSPQQTLVGIELLSSTSVSDGEGHVGLPYRSGGDPRTVAPLVDISNINPGFVVRRYFPAKYGIPAFISNSQDVGPYWHSVAPVVVASGVEARLVEAEAALHAQPPQVETWLTTLNALRTDGTYTVSGTDAVWNAGTGGVAGLAPLTDPGTAAARVDLLFAERAKWLFADGHRQGDLRRLLRQYPQYYHSQAQVYPSGLYTPLDGVLTGITYYGSDVTAPVPTSEAPNPLFRGCFSRAP